MKSKPRTPPAVDGRVHADAQTENFLEELTDRPVEAQAETQTEPFLDRPPSPLFMPAKSGVDKVHKAFAEHASSTAARTASRSHDTSQTGEAAVELS